MTARRALALVLLAALAVACAPPAATAAANAGPCRKAAELDAADDAGPHAPLDRVVRAHVADGRVRYDCLAEDAAALDGYLETLAGIDPESLERDARMALWINAYNAFTLRLILDHWPGIESIRDIPRARRWKDVRWNVGGTRHSLDGIEHEILRPRFREPRVHFALVCASISCPDLRGEAFVAQRLDEQLEDATRRFLADPGKGARAADEEGLIFGTRRVLAVSSLFKWFAEDFEEAGGTVAFVRPRLGESDREYVDAHRDALTVRYLDYDWGLNGP